MVFSELRKALLKRSGDLLLSVIGFWAALAINTYLADRSDRETFDAMSSAIKTEQALNEGWLKVDLSIPGYVGSKDYGDQVTIEALGDPIFLRQGNGTLVRELGSYVASIEAMNSLRRSREALLFEHEGA